MYYCNLLRGLLFRMLRRGGEHKAERLLDFPPLLPPFITRAFPSRIPFVSASASDLVFFGAEQRIELAFTLLGAVTLEFCGTGIWQQQGSPVGVGLGSPDVS